MAKTLEKLGIRALLPKKTMSATWSFGECGDQVRIQTVGLAKDYTRVDVLDRHNRTSATLVCFGQDDYLGPSPHLGESHKLQKLGETLHSICSGEAELLEP